MGQGHAAGWVWIALTGCSATVPAAATRVLDGDAASLAKTPICFAPASPEWSLTAKDQHQRLLKACESAAKKHGVPVVPPASGGCLLATTKLSSRYTGTLETDCVGTVAICESTAIHAKTLKLDLAEPGKRAVAETTASISSPSGTFTEQSYVALCSAAFRDYPQPLSNAQFDVDTE